MAEKHINYFAYEKACENPGCPLCTIVSERAKKYIDNMLFEHVSDRGFRAKCRQAGGFCANHSKHLESFHDGLAVAILGEDILYHAFPLLQKGKVPKYTAPCPACAETQRIENDFLSFLLESHDEPFIAFFTRSEGLCVPHYQILLGLKKKVPLWLRDFQETKFQNLLTRVREFIECSAWGRQQDFALLSEADKLVWKELAKTLRGTKE